VKLALRVQPGAKRSALLARLASGEWKVAVSAPPVEGRANDAVVELVSGLLGVKRRQVTVARGTSSRSKLLEVEGLSAAEAEARLAAALPAAGAQHDREPDAEHEDFEANE
jgi:uncharacterized protein YggU (UPF0235/DUF167 family)